MAYKKGQSAEGRMEEADLSDHWQRLAIVTAYCYHPRMFLLGQL